MRRTIRIGTRIAAAALLAWALVPSAAPAGVLVTPGGVRFTYEAPNARSVSLAGTLNDWNSTANPMVQEDGGIWSTVMRLGPGTYEYKFVVDGQWIADPDNPVTVGDYGNSALVLDDSGRIAEMEATANTEYSAKILMYGRSIATFRSVQNRDNGRRYELDRPNLDTDLGFAIRINDALNADVLTNINNESDVDIYRTRLNFDRGVLDFREEGRRIRAWDNYDVGAWEDPLHLVGDVGIYHHAFGYGTQGVMFEESRFGWSGRFLYADDFADGSTATPPRSAYYATSAVTRGEADDYEFWEAQGDGQLRVPGSVRHTYDFNYSSFDEDIMAARVSGPAGPVTVGVSARMDRGYNPATLGVTGDLTDAILAISDSLTFGDWDTTLVSAQTGTRTVYQGTEQWYGGGVDLAWSPEPDGPEVRTEALWGRSQYFGRTGETDGRFFLATAPESLSIDGSVRGLFAVYDADSVVGPDEFETPPPATAVDSRTFDLDDSWRFFLGVTNLPEVAGVASSASVELQKRRFEPVATGLQDRITNRATTYRLRLDRPVSKRIRAALALEANDFHYDRKSPWEFQFWFDYRNFWLENNEHTVSFDRLVMLGDDAIFWRPSVAVDVWEKPRIRVSYDGTFAQSGLTREPKYTETLLKGSWLIRPRWELHCDLRFVKYNDRILDLNDAYNETFLELKHEIAEGVEIAVSYGVDPWVLDDPVNEYAYIGRDLYLFDRGANAETAREDFLGLARSIRGAENALEAARVIQVEAMMRF